MSPLPGHWKEKILGSDRFGEIIFSFAPGLVPVTHGLLAATVGLISKGTTIELHQPGAL